MVRIHTQLLVGSNVRGAGNKTSYYKIYSLFVRGASNTNKTNYHKTDSLFVIPKYVSSTLILTHSFDVS